MLYFDLTLGGIFRELDFSSWKPVEKATLKFAVADHCCKLTAGGNEFIEIDAENRGPNGFIRSGFRNMKNYLKFYF